MQTNYKRTFNTVSMPQKRNEEIRDTLLSRYNELRKDNNVNTRPLIIRKHRFAIIAAVVVLTILLTSTALAATTGYLQNLFGNNPTVLDNIQHEVDFTVIDNTYEGISFEVVGVYADSGSFYLIVYAISDEPLFPKPTEYFVYIGHSIVGLADYSNHMMLPKGFLFSNFDIHFIDETRLMLTWFSGASVGNVTAGSEHIVTLENAIRYYIIDYDGRVIREESGANTRALVPGTAVFRVTIPDIVAQNQLRLEPNIILDSGDILSAITISPFAITFFYEGDIEYEENFYLEGCYIRMKDGSIRDLSWRSCFIASMSGGLTFESLHYDISFPTYINLTFSRDKTIAVEDIEAVIYNDIEILVHNP